MPSQPRTRESWPPRPDEPARPRPSPGPRSTGRPSALDALVAERVRLIRTRRGWGQRDLAVAAGWSHASVAAVEAGTRRLTVRDAAVLCRVLQVPLLSLVDGAEEAAALGLAPQAPHADDAPADLPGRRRS